MQTTNKRQKFETPPPDDFYDHSLDDFKFEPTTPTRFSVSPVQSNDDMHPLSALIEQLFDEGVAHEHQWTFPTKHLVPQHERDYVLQVLKERFGASQKLYNQLPCEEPDPVRNAFYNCRENWFYQLLEKEGYDPNIASATLVAWLKGEINTLVLCGSKLSNAKLLFNVLLSCFPLAVADAKINSMNTLADIAPHTSLYCLPFVEEKPNSLMLHYMEGNSINCVVHGTMHHIPSTAILIHCADISVAHYFACRNTSILFLTGEYRSTPVCHTPRKELRDLAHNAAAGAHCLMNIHCKRENEMCDVCIRALPVEPV